MMCAAQARPAGRIAAMTTGIPGLLRGLVAAFAAAWMLGCEATAQAPELVLGGYQRADGAITLYHHGDRVDPYFAGMALLAGDAAGMDVRRAATAWIEWALKVQRADGRFDRYCLAGGAWRACDVADADDSALAVWIELLVKLAPAAGMPTAWAASMERALAYLERLIEPKRGTFVISEDLPVGLFMDNTEVYRAYQAVGGYHRARGNARAARQWQQKSEALRAAIWREFWMPAQGRYRVSLQPGTHDGFYPEVVAQLYPILAGMPEPRDSARAYRDWMARHESAWQLQADTDFPWGLVALVAWRQGDEPRVRCWLQRAAPYRYSPRWNAVEEAVFASLLARSGGNPRCA